MRADVTNADLAAFCISAFMLAVMVMTLLLLLTVILRSARQSRTTRASTGGQSDAVITWKSIQTILSIFNVSLLGMIVGSVVLFSSRLLSLTQSHSYLTVRGAILLESFGGTLFESCYCIYTWSRSKSLIGESGSVLYWILSALAVLNPILFIAQLITGVLLEFQVASTQLYHDVGVATIAGVFLLDVGMLSCFSYFLLKNPAPTTSTGQFNGNSEAQKQWYRTSIIAKYGAFSCGASFLTLAMIVADALFLPLSAYTNLLSTCAYFAAGLAAIILLVMKIKLEGGYGNLFASTAKSEECTKTKDEES
ncbi:hypothetical protein BJ741DRAFT_631968 [Chytriomyces cf. hyalinus JEL632]|nr:hypothetical protein BJ741DRAFT_631968 [Chytriomyces cf. hyalinus JEL632]